MSIRLSEYSALDATGIAHAIRKRDLSAEEVRLAAAAAVACVNPRLNAALEVFQDRIDLGDPQANPGGPWAGVPFMLKDIGAGEEGRRQERGSRLFAGAVSTFTSSFTLLCKRAGMVNIGRTTTPEAGLAGTTESLAHGITRNPWDPSLSTSGSSGGAAALVAAGALPVAHGSDGAGSIRMPAAACGLVGLKPARGRISAGPLLDEMGLGLVTEFLLCRTVRDAHAALHLLALPQPGDPLLLPPLEGGWSDSPSRPLHGLRVGYSVRNWRTGAAVPEEALRAVQTVASALERLGCHVEAAEPEFEAQAAYEFNGFVFDMLTLPFLARAASSGRALDDGAVEPVTRSAAERIARCSGIDFARMLQKPNLVRRSLARYFTAHDLLLTPTVPQARIPLGSLACSSFDDVAAFRRASEERQFAFTCPFNVTGQPAISLPALEAEDGFPLGVQLVGKPAGEGVLLGVAAALEQALPWATRRPSIHAGGAGAGDDR